MITLVSAPTNLGLRPPEPGGVPGASKAPEALREAGLFRRFAERGACEGGVVLPGRYVDDDDATRPPGRVRNQAAIVDHARRLAARIEAVRASGAAPLVIGGDCSLLLGVGLALSADRRCGLVHLDGHTDFRHPGNSTRCGSVAGEDLAAVVGLHWPALSDIDGRGPYVAPERAAHVGHRADDRDAAEARSVIGLVVPAEEVRTTGPDVLAATVSRVAGERYWLQLDVDILDPTVMPAVDSPDPGGLSADELTALLQSLAPRAIGASVTVFDPDLDPDGRYAEVVVEILLAGLTDLGAVAE